ncbi:MAG: YgiQ family radical SAM protein [Bacteroidales bacterium]
MERYAITNWIPVTKKEVDQRGWEPLDVILISGDAYVDHPSFGTAVIARIIEKMGYKVAIVPQPNWQDDLRDFKKLGKPRLFFGVNAGVMDSMVNHYTAHKRLRSNDAYTPGDRAGARPDYAVTVYSQILKKLFPDVPVVIGGVEASQRRFTHYDYWSDQLKPSVLVESGADVLVYGMGEQVVKELLKYYDQKGSPLKSILQIGYLSDSIPEPDGSDQFVLHSHEECLRNKNKFGENFKVIETESNKMHAKKLIQAVKNKFIVVNPPFQTQTEDEADEVYDLPYTRLPHPKYNKKPPIPAFEMIRNSVNMHRGCFGGCSFCTISAHQGKFISSRSEKSILSEVDKIANTPGFKGTISDIGGPSANMYKMKGKDLRICEFCERPSCIFPSVCRNLDTDHKPMTRIYKKAAEHTKVKNVFIGSGIRYDLFIDKSEEESKRNGYEEYTEQVIRHHVSGRLKVAPEHTADNVLKIMRKPSFSYFDKLKVKFDELNEKDGTKRQLIPYFISSHPGCRIEEMADLAIKTKEHGLRLEQIQDFTPTPMTLATVMYYTGIDPYTGKKVFRANTIEAKKLQRKFFFWYKPENYAVIKATLKKIRMSHLINKLYGRSY